MQTPTESNRQQRRDILLFAATVFVVSGLSLSRLTRAQAPNGSGQGQQRRPGGFGGRAPFVAGTITGGNRNTGVLSISSQFGGGNQTINVTRNTQFATQTTVTVADLNVNDQIQVQGVPTGITASSITAGQMPELPGGGMGGGSGGNSRTNSEILCFSSRGLKI